MNTKFRHFYVLFNIVIDYSPEWFKVHPNLFKSNKYRNCIELWKYICLIRLLPLQCAFTVIREHVIDESIQFRLMIGGLVANTARLFRSEFNGFLDL